MKKNIFQLVLSILLLTLLTTPVYAQVQPGTPHQFFGTVTFTNGPAMDGLSVVAKIEGVEVASTTTKDGKYGYEPNIFYIEDPNNDRYNETIYFFVNGNQANEFYNFKNGESTRLDLTLNVPGPTPTTTTVRITGGGGGGGGGRPATTTTTSTTTTTTIIKLKEKANMDIVNLIIPSDVNANEPFELVVEVKNIGDVEGDDDIILALPEGWTADKWGKRVDLEPSETTTLYFSITPNENPGAIAVGSSTDFEVSGEIIPRVMERPLGITGMFLTALAEYWWIVLIIIVMLLLFLYSQIKPSRKKPYEYKHKRKKR